MALLEQASKSAANAEIKGLFDDFLHNKQNATHILQTTYKMKSLKALAITEENEEDKAVDQLMSVNAIQHFQIPRTLNDPASFVYNNCGENVSTETAKVKFNHGTTCLAFKFQGGVVVCTDSRATAGGYIASQTVKKVIEINRFLLGTMAGGAADCQFWERCLSEQCRLYALRNKKRISTRAASKMLANMVYQYKGQGLSMGTMVCGWDAGESGGPALYYVDDGGQRLEGCLFSVGSGSMFAYGVLDEGYRYDLTREEALELAERAIYHATFRDAASGGFTNRYIMTKDGWEHVSWNNVADLHEKYLKDGTIAKVGCVKDQ